MPVQIGQFSKVISVRVLPDRGSWAQLTCGYPRNVSFVRTAQLGNENEIAVSAEIYRA
jgi:hypothetical protein